MHAAKRIGAYQLIRALGVLIGAAVLEVGGDALTRRGMEARSWMLAAGALSLVVYGFVVNQGSLDFGRLMGVYIAVLFVVSQIITMVFFRELPAIPTIAGGILMIAGGFTIVS
jgi:drug/metabolite transporter superfamily protein YnfA